MTITAMVGYVRVNRRNELYIAKTNTVHLVGLADDVSGDYINDATGSFTVRDTTGAVFASISGISMTYRTGTNGDYIGVLPTSDAENLQPDALYTIEVTASSSNSTALRQQTVPAMRQDFENA